MNEQQPASVFYKISSYEAGSISTGKSSSNYHCYCSILDQNLVEIKGHPLEDVFYGRWAKCSMVISKWQKACDKSGLINY